MKRATALHEAPAPEPRLYRVVSNRIEALILDANIRPGQRLPSERDLAIQLGVSRTSLREALIDHRSILAAIAAHDVAGARQAMRAHLDGVTRTFSRGCA